MPAAVAPPLREPTFAEVVRALSDPGAYPRSAHRTGPAGPVEVRETHISVVFLAGGHAYKVKKPVRFPFVDYSTPASRRFFCGEELRLNRRLAPRVYRGVVPVVREDGRLRVGGPGEEARAVEWAVWMERLPDEAALGARMAAGEDVGPALDRLAALLASFHASAAGGPEVARHARLGEVVRNWRANFEESLSDVDVAVSAATFLRLRELGEERLRNLASLVERRAASGVPRDGHGDLRLEHVYLLPDRAPPDSLAVLDCVEFDARFRCADPVSDASFLVMDLAAAGRRDLARRFADAALSAARDPEGRPLVPFYAASRAVVRAKVEGIRARTGPEAARSAARDASRARWLLALELLEAGEI
ncbi:MAG: hypothetical protein L0216_15425 [Planctomycetales bacterium]|nr:hypothetical protein [Planctomycetales bacterium]